MSQLRPDDEGWCGLEYIKSLCEETTTDLPPRKEEGSTTNFLKASEPYKEEDDTEVRALVKTQLWTWQAALDSDHPAPCRLGCR